MNLGEFRKSTKDLPDEADIVTDDGDFGYYEAHIHLVLNPVLEHSYCIVLDSGQAINLDLDMDARVDARIGYYGGESDDVNT